MRVALAVLFVSLVAPLQAAEYPATFSYRYGFDNELVNCTYTFNVGARLIPVNLSGKENCPEPSELRRGPSAARVPVPIHVEPAQPVVMPPPTPTPTRAPEPEPRPSPRIDLGTPYVPPPAEDPLQPEPTPAAAPARVPAASADGEKKWKTVSGKLDSQMGEFGPIFFVRDVSSGQPKMVVGYYSNESKTYWGAGKKSPPLGHYLGRTVILQFNEQDQRAGSKIYTAIDEVHVLEAK